MFVLEYNDVKRFRYAVAKWCVLKYHINDIEFISDLKDHSSCMLVKAKKYNSNSKFCISVLSKPDDNSIYEKFRTTIYYRKSNFLPINQNVKQEVFTPQLKKIFSHSIELAFMNADSFIQQSLIEISNNTYLKKHLSFCLKCLSIQLINMKICFLNITIIKVSINIILKIL